MAVTGLPVLRISPQLSIGDAERVAEWSLHHLEPEQRGKMMADMPTVYARVFPGVDPEAILRNVRAALNQIAQQQAEAFAALADKHLAFAGREHTGHFHDPEGRYDYCTDPACPRSAQQERAPDTPSLRRMLEMAQMLYGLRTPGDEYVRGQVSLICNLFGLLLADGQVITEAITHRITIDEALTALSPEKTP